MKKKLIGFMLVVFCMTALLGCSKKGSEAIDDKVSVVTTIFPPYDFTRQIAEDQVELTMLLKSGAESHSYEPSVADIKKIQECDIFIYTGSENETWVKDILASFDSSSIQVIRMLDCVDVLEEELVEGMQEEAEPEETTNETEQFYQEGESQEESGEIELDEHVWTSPKNAIKIVNSITEAIVKADPDHESSYVENSATYVKKLEELDQKFIETVAKGNRKEIVLGDRFPFRYLANEYGLSYRAAFPGCSTDTEPSAATIAYLVNYVKEQQIPVVFTIEFSNGKIADIICEETGAKKLLLHSCHNLSKDELEAGTTYLEIMEQNLVALEEALR